MTSVVKSDPIINTWFQHPKVSPIVMSYLSGGQLLQMITVSLIGDTTPMDPEKDPEGAKKISEQSIKIFQGIVVDHPCTDLAGLNALAMTSGAQFGSSDARNAGVGALYMRLMPKLQEVDLSDALATDGEADQAISEFALGVIHSKEAIHLIFSCPHQLGYAMRNWLSACCFSKEIRNPQARERLKNEFNINNEVDMRTALHQRATSKTQK